jgi:hypothetical protein
MKHRTMLQCLVEWGLTAKLACLAHQSGKLVQQKVVPASSQSLEDAQILGIYCPIRRSHAETIGLLAYLTASVLEDHTRMSGALK